MKVCVIGGCNVDFIVKSDVKIEEATSNPASINIEAGGVGENLCGIFKRLGANVDFITCLGKDPLSNVVKNDLIEKKITAHIVEKEKTGIYTAIINNDGVLQTAFCDMKSMEEVSFEEIMALKLDFLSYDAVIIDANLCEDTINKLCENFKKNNIKYALEAVSNVKCLRFKKVLDGAYLIKPNKYEAQELTGVKVCDLATAENAADILLEKGVHNVIISIGSKGFLFKNKKFKNHLAPEVKKVVDVTGAGDALFTSVLVSLLKGIDEETSIKIGRKCADLTCMVFGSFSPDINEEIFNK